MFQAFYLNFKEKIVGHLLIWGKTKMTGKEMLKQNLGYMCLRRRECNSEEPRGGSNFCKENNG